MPTKRKQMTSKQMQQQTTKRMKTKQTTKRMKQMKQTTKRMKQMKRKPFLCLFVTFWLCDLDLGLPTYYFFFFLGEVQDFDFMLASFFFARSKSSSRALQRLT